MQRVTLRQRDGWQQIVEGQGLLHHTHENGLPYWMEGVAYQFSPAQIQTLETATSTLQALCLQAIEHVIATKRYRDFAIPAFMIPVIEASWEQDEVSIYGRFDLAYDGQGPPKLLEYNADTPTALLEAAVIQWFWLQDLMPHRDQFNSIHERLVEAWKRAKGFLPLAPVAFLHQDTEEDIQTVAYLRDTADKAGVPNLQMFVEDLGWDPVRELFVDLDEHPVTAAFKLYPWEFMVKDAFGPHLAKLPRPCAFLEPPWKMLLSNKAILAVLWELNPGHENLLPAYLDGSRDLAANGFVQKPLLGREGANVTLYRPGQPPLSSPVQPVYGAEGSVFQALAPIPQIDGFYPVLGSWVVDGEPAGMGIRESENPITGNSSAFVPHFIMS
jgi:glutathionylspermidine synthase